VRAEKANLSLRTICPWVIITLVAVGPARGQRQRPAVPSPLTPALSAVRPEVLGAVGGFLSDSLLHGRVPGTPGGTLAARFLAAQFRTLGLTPAGAGGTFFQPVPLIRVRARPSIVLGAGRETFTPKSPDEIVLWPLGTDSTVNMDGELVFAGFGIEAPEFGWDDYKGVPQTGRIVMVLAGDPSQFDSTTSNDHRTGPYSNWTYKLDEAAKMGAAGVLIIHSADATGLSWSALAGPLAGDHLWLEPRPASGSLKFAAWIREDLAKKLLQAAGRDYPLLRRRALRPEFSPLSTGIHAAIDIDIDVSRSQGLNVVARMDGTDSTARGEPVIIAAPYVRLGTDATFWRDSGSTVADETAGVATLLATAAGVTRLTPSPRRPILFVATAGRPGAEVFTAAMQSARQRPVAVLHLEGSPPHGVSSLTTLGADRSSLGDIALSAAQAEGVVLETPAGSQADFLTAGAYPYTLAGPPALDFRPDGSPRTGRLVLRMAWLLANGTQFPTWLPGMETLRVPQTP